MLSDSDVNDSQSPDNPPNTHPTVEASGNDTNDSDSEGWASRHPFLLGILHLFVLSSFAVAQPIYDLLGKHGEFLIARGAGLLEVFVLVTTLSLAVPSLIALGVVLLRPLGHGLYDLGHALVAGSLAVVSTLPLIKQLSCFPGWKAFYLCAVLTALAALAYRKIAAIRLWLSVLAIVVVIFPVFFLVGTPISKVIFPKASAQPEVTSPLPHPVLILLFDMFPVTTLMDEQGQLDAERYPNFGRLGDDAHWYRQATTVAISTGSAVPAILTGQYPQPAEGKLPITDDYPGNLFTLVGAKESLNVVETITRLCPRELCDRQGKKSAAELDLSGLLKDTAVIYLHMMLPEAFHHRLPSVDTQWSHFGENVQPVEAKPATVEPEPELDPREARRKARNRKLNAKKRIKRDARQAKQEDRREKMTTFLDQLKPGQAPTLSFLHLHLPHSPFEYLPSGTRYVPKTAEYADLRLSDLPNKIPSRGGSVWSDSEYLVELAYRRMVFQASVADRLLGNLLDHLQNSGMYDETLLVVLADHGQSYTAGQPFRVLDDGDTIHVPLFIKLPGQSEGTIDDRNSEIIDLLPTLAEALDMDPDWPIDGHSLLPPAGAKPALKKVFGFGRDTSVELPWPNQTLDSSLRQKLHRVGSGASPTALYDVGPQRPLIGHRLDALPPGVERVAGQDTVHLHVAPLLEAVDTRSGFVPAYLTGTFEVQTPLDPPFDVALALNGTIQATGQSFLAKNGNVEFAFMAPESAFIDGENSWQVLRIEEVDGAIRLRTTVVR